MAELPWLVVHGVAAFRAALGAAVLAGLFAGWVGPWAGALREARRARARLGRAGPAADLCEGAAVTLTGELGAGGAPCERFDDRAEASAATVAIRAGRLAPAPGESWIALASVRAETLTITAAAGASGPVTIELVGPVDVLAGSREVVPCRPVARLRAGVQARIGARLEGRMPGRGIPVMRSLRAGDAVRVRGILRREPMGEAAGGYRTAPRRWTLVGEGLGGAARAIPLASERLPRVVGPGLPRLAAGALAGGALVAGLALAAGHVASVVGLPALREARFDRDGRRAEGLLSAFSPAAVSPLHRGRALAEMAGLLASRCLHDHDRAHVERLVALDELRGDCAAAAGALLDHGQLDAAAATAKGCRRPRLEAQAHYLAGRFAQASEALERDHDGIAAAAGARDGQTTAWPFSAARPPTRCSPSGPAAPPRDDALFDARVHLLAGRLDLAAGAARKAGERGGHAAPDVPFHEEAGPRAASLICVADALDARSGDPGALGRLRAAQDDRGCRLLLADLLPPAERAALLPAGAVGDLLAAEARLATHDGAPSCKELEGARFHLPGEPSVLDAPASLFDDDDPVDDLYPPAVAERVLALLAGAGGRCPFRGRVAASAAMFASLAGDHRAARDLAEGAVSDLARTAQARAALALAAAVEIGAGGEAVLLLDRAGRVAPDEKTLAEQRLTLLAEVGAGRSDVPVEAVIPPGLLPDATRVANPLLEAERWRELADGDGQRLAAWLQRHDAQGLGAFVQLGAPLLRTGQAEVRSWLRWGDRRTCLRCPAAQVFTEAARRRAAASALGDADLAAELAAPVDAFRRALLRRDLAIPLAVLDGG